MEGAEIKRILEKILVWTGLSFCLFLTLFVLFAVLTPLHWLYAAFRYKLVGPVYVWDLQNCIYLAIVSMLVSAYVVIFENKKHYSLNKVGWWNEDKRLPIWVRNEVFKYKMMHPSYKHGDQKTFIGKRYVYKFTWWETVYASDSGMHDYPIYHEKWIRERRH